MDRNTLLAFVLSMGVFTLWLVWQAQNAPQPGDEVAPFATQLEDDAARPEAAPGEPAIEPPPAEREVAETPTPAEPLDAPPPRPATPAVEAWQRAFANEYFTARLDNRGAGIGAWTLSRYRDKGTRGREGAPIELVSPDSENEVAFLTPFRELGLGDLSRVRYQVESENENAVTFAYRDRGVTIRKTYEFAPAEYRFDLTVTVENGTDRVLSPAFEIDWPAAMVEGNDYREKSLVALTGEEVERHLLTSIGSPGFFGGLFGGGDPADLQFTGVSWAGIDLKYFLGVLLFEKPRLTAARFEPITAGESARSVADFEPVELAPGSSATRRVSAFLGPKRPELLQELGHDLIRSIDLGWSWVEPLTRFFQWLLRVSYAVVPNYGVVIILITIMVRVATLPIMNRQMRSMEKMRALQPRMKEIQEKHADDRQKQSEAMMAMYKETGVNPLAGCFPMLLQLPVFIGLFYALQSSFDLRQAPFVAWINDLSAPEALFYLPGLDLPVRVLPLVMGGSMYFQQKLTPMTTMDPSQQMMMQVMMPIMMTVLFYQFPSGLVLYWMVSNFLGIAHQLFIGRQMRADE